MPDNDDSTHGTKSSLDRGDLSDWEYLTKLYDNDDLHDDHNMSMPTNHDVHLLPQNYWQSFIPSNLPHLGEPFKRHDTIDTEPTNVRRHDTEDESDGAIAKELRTSQSLYHAYQNSLPVYQHDTDLAQVAVSSDQQRWMINPSRYPHRPDPFAHTRSVLNHSYQEISTPVEAVTGSRNQTDDRKFTANVTVDDKITITQRTEHHDGHISDVNTYAPVDPWSMNHDRYATVDQESTSIRWKVDVSQYSNLEYQEIPAAIEKKPEKESKHQPQRNDTIPDDNMHAAVNDNARAIVTDPLIPQTRIGNNSILCDTHDTSSHHETVSIAPPAVLATGNTYQSMTVRPNLDNVPPYQQYNNSSLLLKPLTPYNYYYRDERDNIVLQITAENDPLPPPVSDFSLEKMQSLLEQHWYEDPVRAKRIHRKTHGKMSFQNLSKIISERWRALPSQGREFYRSVARSDEMYYNQHLMKLLSNDGLSGIGPTVPSTEIEPDESKPQFQSDDRAVK